MSYLVYWMSWDDRERGHITSYIRTIKTLDPRIPMEKKALMRATNYFAGHNQNKRIKHIMRGATLTCHKCDYRI